jgi:hypothetical protein
MQIRLKSLHQYRNTIFLIVGLILFLFLVYILWLTNKPVEYPALNPNSVIRHRNPINPRINWQKARLGLSRSDLVRDFGEPAETLTQSDAEILIYLDNPTITTRRHEFWLTDNRVTRIVRTIDSSVEDIYPEYYQRNFGNPEILREYIKPGDFRWLSFQVSTDNYIVLEYDPQVNKIYKIINANQKNYEDIRNELQQQPTQIYFGVGEEE